MNDMYHNLTSFLAIWFRNLQKSTYNVSVVNKEVDKISPLLYEKLQAIHFLLQDLQGKELKVKVSNQTELNTKDLEEKLTSLLIGVKGIKLDNGTVERLLSDLISLSKGIKKVEVLNQPAMPSHMSVAGKVEVSNLPKVQEVKGDFNLKESKDILNALKELATEIRDLKLESIQGYKNMGSTFIGSTGSREAHKLTDGTNTATITTVGSDHGLDVNIIGGSSSGTEYTEGDVDTSIAGGAMLAEAPSNTLKPLQLDASNYLKVNVVAGGAGDGSILDGVDTGIKATVKDLTNANPVTVAIVDGSGDQITSFGGGTQYTEADTDASITGTAILWEDTADTLRVVSAAKPLPVSDAGGTLTVDGTVAVTNAGITTIAGAVAGTEMQVDVLTMPTTTITGTVDLGATDNAVLDNIDADLTTIIGHVDGIEALLTTIDADTSNLSVVGGGTEASALRVTIANNSTGVLSIDDNGSTVSIDDGGGVITVDGTVAVTNSDITSIKTATELLDDTVFVDDADWTADTSKHMLVGGVTQTAPTANTDGDTTPLITNNLRELRVAAKESDLATAGTTHVKKYYTNAGAVTDGIIWSPAAGKRWYCTLLAINVSAAATVTIEDDLAAGDSPVYKAELAANSGVVIPFGADAPMFSGEDAADLLVTTTAGNVYITAVGYEV